MTKAGVAIVYRDSLFAEGLASLLRTEGSLDVLEMITTEAVASDRIRMLRPAVVILEGDLPEGERSAVLGQLLAGAPCVVELGLDSQTVAVHRRAQLRQSQRFEHLIARLARRSHLARERRET